MNRYKIRNIVLYAAVVLALLWLVTMFTGRRNDQLTYSAAVACFQQEQVVRFVVDDGGAGMAGLRDGSINAIFTGSWDSASIREILGENMGVAALPTYNLNGEEKQMYSYAGSKAVGVNSRSENMVAAVELAVYLGSAEAQRLHYELRSAIPSNTELMDDAEIAADPVVIAQNDTFDRTSKLQPFVPKMTNCWTPVENMGRAIQSGTTTHANAAEQTKAMNDAMNSDGIS